MQFENRLKQALEGHNLAEVGRQIAKDRSTVSNYGSGRREPDFATLAHLCQLLEVSADWVLGLSEDRRPAAVRASAARAARREHAHARAKDPLEVARTSLDRLEVYVGELEDENRRLREQLENRRG
jgi:transcriptional regulator with XRE-family HTH domain